MKESMRSKLKQIARRLEEIDAMLASPDVTNDMNRFRDLSRERAEIEPVVLKLKEYESTEGDMEAAREMLEDPESADFAQEEIDNGKKHLEALEKDLQIMLLPRDPNDSKNIYLEIRAGTAAMNRHSLPAIFFVCTPAMLNAKAGARKLFPLQKVTWAAIRK